MTFSLDTVFRVADKTKLRTPIYLALRAALYGGVAGVPLVAAVPVYAQEVRAHAIPAGPLEAALVQFSAASGVTVSFAPDLVRGLQTQGLQGAFTADEGLRKLLEDSGAEAQLQGSGSYTLRAAPSKETTLRAVKVVGAGADTATENTGSYTPQKITAGSKLEQSLREIPRSISVITRQQLDDQRIATFDEALAQLPGVTTSPSTGGWGNTAYSVRGHSLSSVSVDGSPTRGRSSADSSFDTGMAKYDNIQLLRGPDGLFSGNGQPSGSINLVRKRPLDVFQAKTALSAGSWDNYLGEIDVSSPLTDDRRLRGRAVVAYNDTEKFYDYAHRKNSTVYGVLDLDIADHTTLGLGISRDKKWGQGQDYAPSIPRYITGEPLGIRRSLGGAPFSRRDSTSDQMFANLSHEFSDNWSMKAMLTHTESDGSTIASRYQGAVSPLTGAGSYFLEDTPQVNWTSESTAADISMTGDFSLLERRHKIVAGFDYVKTKAETNEISDPDALWGPTASNGIDWNTFDPGNLPRPNLREHALISTSDILQRGVYFYTSLQIHGPLRAVLGARYSTYENDAYESWLGDAYSKSDRLLTPYYALVYNLSAQWTAYVTATEGYEDQSNYYGLTRKRLDPATSRSVELGIKGEHFGGRLNSNITVYRTQRTNFAVLVETDENFGEGNPGGACCYAGDGEFLAQGVEFDISGELAPDWQLNAGYTFDDNKTEYGASDGKRYATTSPRHIFRAWNRYQLTGALSPVAIGGGVRAQSSFYQSGTVPTWNPSGGPSGTGAYNGPGIPYEFTAPGRALWSAFAEYRFNPHWTVALNVDNLFDKRYFQGVDTPFRGDIYGEPRSWKMTLRGQF